MIKKKLFQSRRRCHFSNFRNNFEKLTNERFVIYRNCHFIMN